MIDLILAGLMMGLIFCGALTLIAASINLMKRDRELAQTLNIEKAELLELAEGLRERQHTLELQRDELITERDGLSGELLSVKAQRDDLTGELSSVKAQRDELKGRKDGIAKKQESRTVASLKLYLAEFERKNKELTKERAVALKKLDALKKKNEELSKKADEHSKEEQRLQGELDDAIAYAKDMLEQNSRLRTAIAKSREILIFAKDSTSSDYLLEEMQRASDLMRKILE